MIGVYNVYMTIVSSVFVPYLTRPPIHYSRIRRKKKKKQNKKKKKTQESLEDVMKNDELELPSGKVWSVNIVDIDR